MIDVVFGDLFMKKNGVGVLVIPDNPARREQYLKRREIRLSLMRHYESQYETELTGEEVDMIDNDPQLQG